MSTNPYYLQARIESIAEPEVRDEIEAQIAAFWWDRGEAGDGYTPVGVVTLHGRVVGLVPEEESRRDIGGDGTHIWAGIPKGRRWDWTRLRALRAVAEDLELFRDRRDRDRAARRMATLSFDDLLRAIHREVPERLAVAYRKIGTTSPPPRGPSRQALAEARSFRISEGYRLLRQAADPPFTDTMATPYEYRAFDLHGEGANAIAVVNIHT